MFDEALELVLPCLTGLDAKSYEGAAGDGSVVGPLARRPAMSRGMMRDLTPALDVLASVQFVPPLEIDPCGVLHHPSHSQKATVLPAVEEGSSLLHTRAVQRGRGNHDRKGASAIV